MLINPEAAREAGTDRAAEMLHAALVDQIVEGVLLPGDALNEQALAARFGVSRTPVREALQRLVIAGIAERGPRRSLRVRRLDYAALGDLFEAHGEVEALCAQYAALRMTALERRLLAECVEEGEDAAARNDVAAYTRLNAQFHGMLLQGAHNAALQEISGNLNLRTAPYRQAQFRQTERLHASQTEHRRVLQAVLEENPRAAREAMLDHMTAVSSNVTRMLRRG
ncbi:GntR family transcriptional regulator [Camelimonas abortus]|uniref:GntR family transcriptional regulator n=1 Tax=Camelimonas abortus TaxID=1017184 RepID=A0ABV7LC71_9HYPH